MGHGCVHGARSLAKVLVLIREARVPKVEAPCSLVSELTEGQKGLDSSVVLTLRERGQAHVNQRMNWAMLCTWAEMDWRKAHGLVAQKEYGVVVRQKVQVLVLVLAILSGLMRDLMVACTKKCHDLIEADQWVHKQAWKLEEVGDVGGSANMVLEPENGGQEGKSLGYQNRD